MPQKSDKKQLNYRPTNERRDKLSSLAIEMYRSKVIQKISLQAAIDFLIDTTYEKRNPNGVGDGQSTSSQA